MNHSTETNSSQQAVYSRTAYADGRVWRRNGMPRFSAVRTCWMKDGCASDFDRGWDDEDRASSTPFKMAA